MNVLMQKYKILGKKGEGTFSEVLKCQNIKDGTYWACKKMKQHYDGVEQVNNLREIQALRRLNPHVNILELHEVIFEKKSGVLVLVCELMDMNIYELIRGRRQFLPEPKIKSYMYQLCKSLDHMHRNGIFHRDVKPENILIKDELLKLADFGSCRSVYSKQPYTEYISTRWYRAPECLLTDGYYTYKMDMWSVGCVFFEIMSLHPLFPGSNEVDQIAKIHDVMGTPEANILNKLRNKARGMNFNFPPKKGSGIEKHLPHASAECLELIYQLCSYDPDERISAKQALRHTYFKELRDVEKRQNALQKASELQTETDNENTAVVQPDAADTRPAPQNNQEKQSGAKIIDLNKLNLDTNNDKNNPPTESTTTFSRNPVLLPERRKRRRYKRISDNSFRHSLFPNHNKPAQPATVSDAYSSSTYSGVTTTFPKIQTHPMLPSINGLVRSKAKANSQPNKTIYGHYQLPSIDRRNGARF
ncbi:MAPK/MAK/MRK overlapping kinase-like isoform X2 [Tubulanus polymorphus]|uniref:MAPK/MAK/MRK overlapping kinase-like isoform X2 n=1 Tax=Tubulanus polymorphus TaxID=672921 RepID=UPI003DA45CF6